MFASTLLSAQSVNLVVAERLQTHERVSKDLAGLMKDVKNLQDRIYRTGEYTLEDEKMINALKKRIELVQKATLVSIAKLKGSFTETTDDDDPKYSEDTVDLTDSPLKDKFIFKVELWSDGAETALNSAQTNMILVSGDDAKMNADTVWGGVKVAFKAIPFGGAIATAVDNIVAIGKVAYATGIGSSDAPNVNDIKNGLKEGYREIGKKAADLVYPAFVSDWKKENLIPEDMNTVFKDKFTKDVEAFLSKFFPDKSAIEKGFSKAVIDSLEDEDWIFDAQGDMDDAGYIDIRYDANLEWGDDAVKALRAMNHNKRKVRDNLLAFAMIGLYDRVIKIDDCGEQIATMFKQVWMTSKLIDTPFKIRFQFSVGVLQRAEKQLMKIANNEFMSDDEVEENFEYYKKFINKTTTIWRMSSQPGNTSFKLTGGHPVFLPLVNERKLYKSLSVRDLET